MTVVPHADELRRDSHAVRVARRSEEHTSELQSQSNLVCRLLLEKKKRPDPAHSQREREHSTPPSAVAARIMTASATTTSGITTHRECYRDKTTSRSACPRGTSWS